MRRLIIAIIILFMPIICFSQLPDSVKHIEVVSEIKDTMLLINKNDADIINTVFYQYDILDSLNTVNEQIISDLNIKNFDLENIISEQNIILDNKDTQIYNIKQQNKEVISNLEKQVKRANIGKTVWESLTGIGIVTIIFLVIF